MVYNDKTNSDKFKASAFGGLDALLSISEMPTGSPVVTVGVNKAANAGLYAIKILDRKSTRLNSSHSSISYAVFCLKKKNTKQIHHVTFLRFPLGFYMSAQGSLILSFVIIGISSRSINQLYLKSDLHAGEYDN